jgi:hypothetical protein
MHEEKAACSKQMHNKQRREDIQNGCQMIEQTKQFLAMTSFLFAYRRRSAENSEDENMERKREESSHRF